MAKKNKGDFHNQTVLFHWGLSELGVSSLDEFRQRYQIGPDTATGINPHTGDHYAYEAIAFALRTDPGHRPGVLRLREYDQNILEHTRQINEARQRHDQPIIRWQYFQYLTLLLSELYFDRYFDDAAALREELNGFIRTRNALAGPDTVEPFPRGDVARAELGRLAFWCATGSGKTLLMHMHLRQFRHYHAKAVAAGVWKKLDQVLLVTPNAGLSKQHEQEFRWSGFRAEAAGSEDLDGLFADVTKRDVTILDIHKVLTQEEIDERRSGGRRFSTSGVIAEELEGCNLVLVDEGHSGVATEDSAWLERRKRLAQGGFTIEYSATFKEAIPEGAKGEKMRNRYARSILTDYAYRNFYRDGFGKDFNILNLEENRRQREYLTMALLLFYQQLKVGRENQDQLGAFGIEKPLWVFVGHTVTGGKASNKDDKESVSDVVLVLKFLSDFIGKPGQSRETLRSLLTEGFVDAKGRDMLVDRLPSISQTGDTEQRVSDVWDGILREVFQAPAGGTLGVQLLKAADGELAIRVGEHDPFAVVYVGDPASVRDACEKQDIKVREEDSYRPSLFRDISRPDSTVNLLVGSRKFTEGWNSYRVSSIGLMHLGKSEGTQIIQLFGRGVRLRGYRGGMRRSSVLAERPTPMPKHLKVLETLQVFGVKAAYMNRFHDWIREEVPEALEKQTWDLPVVQTLPAQKLKMLRLQETIEGVNVKGRKAFDQLGPIVVLRPPDPENPRDDWLTNNPVKLNWLPKVQGITGSDRRITGKIGEDAEMPKQSLTPLHVRMLDVQALLFALETFKAQKGLDRLHVDLQSVEALLDMSHWYELLATNTDMDVKCIRNRGQWQRIAQQLLTQYAEKLHTYTRRLWESPYMEVVELQPEDEELHQDWLVETTALVKDEEAVEAIGKLVEELKALRDKQPLRPTWSKGNEHPLAVWFDGHLFQPLLRVGKNLKVQVRPVGLDKHEAQFVKDLAAWCNANRRDDIFLLRNKAVTGLGFFQAGNFFPDFLLWLCDGDRQYLAFIDPKGLHHFTPLDAKVQFHKRDVPVMQKRVTEQSPGLTLNAFLLSNTLYPDLGWSNESKRMSVEEVENLNVIFQTEGYIEMLMNRLLATA